ncbi:MAG: hypothetical protein N2449_02175 [Bacteroidales bacterium]|nr:hypothetical protein [Bacteroidales bacterium]
MMRLLLIFFIIISIISCNVTKRYYIRGEYDRAIVRAVKKIKKNAQNEKEIFYLEKSYIAANQRDNEQLRLLKLEGKPENWDDILTIYQRLKERQSIVQPVLPLKYNSRVIQFDFVDYDKDIVQAKQNAAEYWYARGKQLLSTGNRFQAREALNYFKNVKYYYENYQDIDKFIDQAKQQGISKIALVFENNTIYKLPPNFKDEIFNIEFERLDRTWKQYFPNVNENEKYHYVVKLNLKNIQISPEKLFQRESVKTRKVQDGTEVLLDSQNNVVKDSLGNPIRVPRMVEVSCKLIETIQQKAAHIDGEVIYFDVDQQKTLTTKPIASDYFFEHTSYIAYGDLRALDDDIKKQLGKPPIPFPNDMEMIAGNISIFKNVFYELLRDNNYLLK